MIENGCIFPFTRELKELLKTTNLNLRSLNFRHISDKYNINNRKQNNGNINGKIILV